MKGIVLAGGAGTRLHPITKGMSKQMLPIYDKPMIYYPVSTLMLAGIRDILIISTPTDLPNFQRLFGDGSQLGISISYAEQPTPDGLAQAFIIANDCGFLKDNEPCALVLGDNVFHGSMFTGALKKAVKSAKKGVANIFSYYVKDPERYGVVNVDENNNILSIEEKPKNPTSNYAVIGLYFYPAGVTLKAREIKPSSRGELEITTLNQMYLDESIISVCSLPRGYAWFDTGTFDSLAEAGSYVETIEKRTGLKIACLEEIAFNNGWISKEQLIKSGESMKNNDYGKYLLGLSNE